MEPLRIQYNIAGISNRELQKLFHNVNTSNMEIQNNHRQHIVKLVAYAEHDALRFRNVDELNFFINKNKAR